MSGVFARPLKRLLEVFLVHKSSEKVDEQSYAIIALPIAGPDIFTHDSHGLMKPLPSFR